MIETSQTMRQQQQLRHASVFGFVRHEIGATLRHLIAAALLSALISAAIVEGVSISLTRTPPLLPTHLAAAIVALALGYAAAVTVLFRALLRGIGRSAEWVTSEIEEATERILHDGSQRLSPGGSERAAPASSASTSKPTRPVSTLEDGVMAGIRME